ncbi:MAG: protein kinase, partial [Myxococcales bacterium]|nr:protein kinase [Myxococcales bacterium]
MMTVERARPPQIGEYEIVGLLGTGGMAEIFLGRQTATGFQRPVVIKRVLQHLVRQESFVAMFLDEARTLASLRHPNIVQIYDVQRSPEELYMVMEYVEGEDAASVRRRLNHRDETLPRALWAYVLSEVCAGLHAAHQLADHNGRRLNLVHRDISPSNVLITYDGAVKLIDFGIAKTDTRSVRTAAGQVKGVFAYMSPEQASGRPIDLRSDLFAIGILLYEFTTGRRLFRRANDLATMQAVCTDPIPPPSAFAADYPPALEAVVMKAISTTGTVTFALVEGDLPTGLTLASDGGISGTPSSSGTFSFTVIARDTVGQYDLRAFGIIVDEPEVVDPLPTGGDDGCSCTSAHEGRGAGAWSLLGLLGGLFLVRRRGRAPASLLALAVLAAPSLASAQVPYFVDTRAENYVERSGGTPVPFQGTDDSQGIVPLPFPFRFY